jgi:hypothetical protein
MHARAAAQPAIHLSTTVRQRPNSAMCVKLCFKDSARQLIEHNKIYAASCEAYSLALYFQRNLLISGGR